MNDHTSAHGGTRYLVGIGFAIFAMLIMGLMQPVGAQRDYASCASYASQEAAQTTLDSTEDPVVVEILDADGNGIACDEAPSGGPVVVDPVSCGHFETQADAQAALDENPELALTLDSDGNGIACEELQTGGPVVVDPVSCGFFDTQEDAQAALDDNPELATTLDSDGDGVACEELQTGGPVVVDRVSCGFFETQKDAQAALDARPELATTLDSDGDGVACDGVFDGGEPADDGIGRDQSGEDAVDDDKSNAADDESDAGDDDESSVVVSLPATGSGPSEEHGLHGPLVAMLALTTIAIALRVHSRRSEI